ncbi:MAG: acyl-CoA dehydratase activase [Synergistaceae bacterium]|jgi:predicted CoA-substrate-specific enzyme activase|nr:acyl-CoA dehydratase activase [Synergistaceae bacterium]
MKTNALKVLDEKFELGASDFSTVGLDIGSRTGKGVLLSDGDIYTAITPTGIYSQETADKLIGMLLRESGLPAENIDFIVGTGYGSIALGFEKTPCKMVTEITCHAMGAYALNSRVKSIVDIGGQDSKAIKVDSRTGGVIEFLMNDKCAAGTGRFLEKLALLLELPLEELGGEALRAQNEADISSQCVVFAESEIISLKAKGVERPDIIAGVHKATARRVRSLFNRIGIEDELVFSGGVSNNIGMKKALEEILGLSVSEVKMDTTYAGALGGALLALQSASRAA